MANAMPRKPQTSMKFRPTARTRIRTSPGPGGGGGVDLGQTQVAVAEELQGLHRKSFERLGHPGLGSRATLREHVRQVARTMGQDHGSCVLDPPAGRGMVPDW